MMSRVVHAKTLSMISAALLSIAFIPAADAGYCQHHICRVAPHRDFNADVSLAPPVAGPIVGPWRNRLLRPSCDRSYPMMESYCGTATGGPVGGTGS